MTKIWGQFNESVSEVCNLITAKCKRSSMDFFCIIRNGIKSANFIHNCLIHYRPFFDVALSIIHEFRIIGVMALQRYQTQKLCP
jgi:hypothetical protein